MEYKRKLTYKDYKKKEYKDLKDFFCGELTFSIIKGQVKEESRKGVQSRVWLLFASNDSKSWECLQVGQSKNNVDAEVETILEYLVIEKNVEPKKNSAFYQNVCPEGSKEEYRENLYSMIGHQFSNYRICFLDVDAYLKIDQLKAQNDADNIIEISKNQYAEAKVAFETMAVYWRAYAPGIDGQTIAYITDNKDQFGL